MKYENDKDIFPERLLKQIQKYAAGNLVYIPATENKKDCAKEQDIEIVFWSKSDDQEVITLPISISASIVRQSTSVQSIFSLST